MALVVNFVKYFSHIIGFRNEFNGTRLVSIVRKETFACRERRKYVSLAYIASVSGITYEKDTCEFREVYTRSLKKKKKNFVRVFVLLGSFE